MPPATQRRGKCFGNHLSGSGHKASSGGRERRGDMASDRAQRPNAAEAEAEAEGLEEVVDADREAELVAVAGDLDELT
ncbi:hypothetical protein GUJ93_ZPchr0006g45781 [Zizania palustris]|uniref:Uncharacterized protein n=1 Tax=Zizania palustris TaxID=103762 RepID=A0A8J5SXZ5_ZIZPA|nr:hypothetical protein GUJ93_ZPchr0006g45781 [Zizania palustris]